MNIPHQNSILDTEGNNTFDVPGNPDVDAFLHQVAAERYGGPIDQIPNLQFQENGRKTVDSAATAAVMALQPSTAAAKASACETLYQQWRFPENAKKRARRDDIAEAARKPIAILRQEIVELATALQESVARENDAKIQASFTGEYRRLCDDLRGLRSFLFVNFEPELLRAESVKKPLIELVKEMLLLDRPPAKGIANPPAPQRSPANRSETANAEPQQQSSPEPEANK